MIQENIFKSFLEDPLLIEKKYITSEQVTSMRIIDRTESKILQIIRIAIRDNVDGETIIATARKINQHLNK